MPTIRRSEPCTATRSMLPSQVKSVSNPHDLWIDVYAEAVLKPFGLANRRDLLAKLARYSYAHVQPCRSQFMAADEASLQRILERNPELQREQFLVRDLVTSSL